MEHAGANTVLKDSNYKEINSHKQNDFVKKMPKWVSFAYILDNLLVRFAPCELLCLEIGCFLCLGVHFGETETNYSQKSFQINLEILCEQIRLPL